MIKSACVQQTCNTRSSVGRTCSPFGPPMSKAAFAHSCCAKVVCHSCRPRRRCCKGLQRRSASTGQVAAEPANTGGEASGRTREHYRGTVGLFDPCAGAPGPEQIANYTGDVRSWSVSSFPYVLSRWIFRQGYRDASTRPSAAGVTGILDPRRDPGCCAASRVDRLR